MAVLRPLKLVIENYPANRTEELDAINHPDDPSAGIRRIPFGRELYIEREDFAEDPPRNFHRMARGGNAPDGRKVRGTIHWVAAADALPAEIRLYHPLFTRPVPGADGDLMADLNPNSLEALSGARVEPGLAGANSDAPVQFERQGYFVRDPDSVPGRLVFNRTVGLRDTWAKTQAAGGS